MLFEPTLPWRLGWNLALRGVRVGLVLVVDPLMAWRRVCVEMPAESVDTL